MLTVETETLENCQAKLVVTVPSERIQKELKATVRRVSKQVNIPGYRKGKAPYHVIARHFGEDAIFYEMLETLGQAVYREALEQSDLKPYAPGSLDDVSRDPLLLTFTIPLIPEVSLGAYRDVRISFEVEAVTNDDVEAALEDLRDDQAVLEPVERPVEIGDVATLDIESAILDVEEKNVIAEDESQEEIRQVPFFNRNAAKILLAEDSLFPVRGFAQKVVGMSAGESRSFDITLPDDDDWIEELRGKIVHFDVTCSEVHRRDLPDLDEDFAQSIGDFETLLELRADIRAQLEERSERIAREEYVDTVMDHLVEEVVEVSYPPIMLEEELDDLIEEFERRLSRQSMDMETYLRVNDQSEEDLREEFRERAEGRLRRALILSKFVEAEKLVVSGEEIDDQIQTKILSFGARATVAEQLFSSPDNRRSIAGQLLTEKAIDRLIQIGRGEAPDLEELDAEQEAETKSASTGEEEDGESHQAVEEATSPSGEASSDKIAEQPAGETETLEITMPDAGEV